MNKNWASLRMKLFGKLLYVSTEYLDLDIAVSSGGFRKIETPYCRKTDTTNLKLLFSKNPERAITKDFEKVLIDSETYHYYSEKFGAHIVITDIPELFKCYVSPRGDCTIRLTDGNDHPVLVLPVPSVYPENPFHVYYPSSDPNELFVVGENNREAVLSILNTLLEVSGNINGSPVPPLTKLPSKLFCNEFVIRGKEDVVLAKFRYFIGESNISYKPKIVQSAEEVVTGEKRDLSTSEHRRIVYNMLELYYLADSICYAAKKRKLGKVELSKGRCLTHRIHSLKADKIDGNRYTGYSRSGSTNKVPAGIFINSLFIKEVLDTLNIGLTPQEMRSGVPLNPGVRVSPVDDISNGGFVNKNTPTHDVVFPLDIFSVPPGKLYADHNVITEERLRISGPTSMLGGINIRMSAPRDEFGSVFFADVDSNYYLCQESIEDYLSGKTIPDVFLRKMSVLVDGLTRIAGDASKRTTELTEESFVTDNTPIVL